MRKGKLLFGENGRQCKCQSCGRLFVVGDQEIFIPLTHNKPSCIKQQLNSLCRRHQGLVSKNYSKEHCNKNDLQKLKNTLVSYTERTSPDSATIADLIDIFMLVAMKIGMHIDIFKAMPTDAKLIIKQAMRAA